LASSEKTAPKTSHWVLLRGLAREARHWDGFPDTLAKAFAEKNEVARIDAIDLPGTGRFSEMKSPITIGELTEFAREKYIEIRRRQRERGETPSERTRILAVSLGGMIAADWLERWPDDFKEAVLINTSFKGFSPIYHRLQLGAAKHILRSLRPLTDFERELHALNLVSNSPDMKAREAVATRWATYAAERPVTLENFSRQLLAAALYRAPVEKPETPTLILYSKNDRMVSPECSKEIIRRWRSESSVHPTGGHDLTGDEPGWVVQKIIDWEQKLKEIPVQTDTLRPEP
jgi:pimeloyl-[acyl-carrier protein] methyl ester esterase